MVALGTIRSPHCYGLEYHAEVRICSTSSTAGDIKRHTMKTEKLKVQHKITIYLIFDDVLYSI